MGCMMEQMAPNSYILLYFLASPYLKKRKVCIKNQVHRASVNNWIVPQDRDIAIKKIKSRVPACRSIWYPRRLFQHKLYMLIYTRIQFGCSLYFNTSTNKLEMVINWANNWRSTISANINMPYHCTTWLLFN